MANTYVGLHMVSGDTFDMTFIEGERSPHKKAYAGVSLNGVTIYLFEENVPEFRRIAEALEALEWDSKPAESQGDTADLDAAAKTLGGEG